MDGIHDLGGKAGFGQIDVEVDEPAFHMRWEAQVFTFLAAGWRSGAIRNVDQFRHAIERVDPAAYLTHGYYGRWLGGLETLFVESGVLERSAIDARDASFRGGAEPLVAARPRADPDTVSYDAARRGARRELAQPARFHLGEQVRTARHAVPGHTRLPAYARGAEGKVVACHAGWVFPDTNAHGAGENPAHLYTVEFSGETLFGDGAEPDIVVNLDLFEPYLEPAQGAAGA